MIHTKEEEEEENKASTYWIKFYSRGFIFVKNLYLGDRYLRMTNILAESYISDSNKLDGENYANWKFKLQTLEGNNTWAIVSGYKVKPVSPQATDAAMQD